MALPEANRRNMLASPTAPYQRVASHAVADAVNLTRNFHFGIQGGCECTPHNFAWEVSARILC